MMAIVYGSEDVTEDVTMKPGKKHRKNKHRFKRILNSKYHRSIDSIVSMHVKVKYPKRVK